MTIIFTHFEITMDLKLDVMLSSMDVMRKLGPLALVTETKTVYHVFQCWNHRLCNHEKHLLIGSLAAPEKEPAFSSVKPCS